MRIKIKTVKISNHLATQEGKFVINYNSIMAPRYYTPISYIWLYTNILKTCAWH